MNIRKILVATTCIAILGGCGTNYDPYPSNSLKSKKIYSYVKNLPGDKNFTKSYNPKIGVESTVNLGDPMMRTGYGWQVDCVMPLFEYDGTNSVSEDFYRGVIGTIVRKGTKMCGDAEGVNYFTPPYRMHVKKLYGAERNVWAIEDIGNGESRWCSGGIVDIAGGSCFQRPVTDYKLIKEFRTVKDSFQRQLEYMGRSGNVLSFIYAEFKEDMAREAYNRNFQVDLSEGNTVNYKGAEIEIIQADNVTVTYIINKYFGGAE